MKQVMYKFFMLGLLFMFANLSFAQNAIKQNPRAVHIFPNQGIFVFYANLTQGEQIPCAGDNRWSVKTDKPGAKELISMVIAAKAAGRTITVYGTDRCNPDGFGYEVNYLYLD